MSAPLLPIPPEIERGAGVLEDDPTYTPESKSEVRMVFPEPPGVRVRLLFPVVPIEAFAPLPRLSVVAEMPRVADVVSVARDEAVMVEGPVNVRLGPDVT